MADIINAIKANDVFELDRLLSQPGRYVNTPIGGGRTPLHVAVQRNRKNIAGILVSRGADVNWVDYVASGVYLLSINGDGLIKLKWLNTSNDELLNCYSIRQDEQADRLPDEDDCTPLMIAILNNNPNLVRWLIDMGADADGKSPDGEPYYKVTENKDIIELLRHKGK